MKCHVLLFLACFLLILPVTGYTVPHIQTVPGCSGESATTPAGYGEINFVSTPPGAWISLDGQILHTSDGGMVIPMMTPGTTNAAAGSHTVMISFPSDYGYSDYSSSVTVCDQQVTYVTATLVPITTTVPTTAAPVRKIMTFAQATTTPVTGTTTLPISEQATTVTSVQGSSTQMTQQETQQGTTQAAGTAPAQPDTLGSLSITTTPAGAFIFIDGIQRGVSPATIPGLSAGTHTVLLKLDGYQDISTPVTIAAGNTQDYTTSLAMNAAGAPAVTETTNATATAKKAPGFEFALALMAMGTVLGMRKVS